jgi:hypothetical protein
MTYDPGNPPPQPYQPQQYSQQAMQQAVAASKSYYAEAFITLVLYWLFWLPGIIANVIFIADARTKSQIAGRSLPGLGCLWILLFFNLVIPAIVCGLLVITGGLGILGASVSGY